MKTEGINLLLLTISAFCSSSRWAPEGRDLSHYVVVIDRFHCMSIACILRNDILRHDDEKKVRLELTHWPLWDFNDILDE